MKCSNCGSSWDTVSTISKCPFCGYDLENAKNQNYYFSSMEDVLAYLIKTYGKQIIKEPRLASYIVDLAPAFKRETRLLRVVIDSGAYQRVLDAEKNSNEEKKTVIVKESARLRDEFYIEEGRAWKAFSWLGKALQWDSIVFDRPACCSFCGKLSNEVSQMFSRDSENLVNICSDCLDKCKSISEKGKSIRCSFCCRPQKEVDRLIAGNNAYICSECVRLCVDILD